MSILNYFSSNVNKRAHYIFNTIAPLYSKIDLSESSHFYNAINQVNNSVNIKDKTVLDLGTGTGEWAVMFEKLGAKAVHGVDFAENMVTKAREKHNNIRFTLGNAEALTDFAGQSFDIVTASFVLHGVKKERRSKMLSEMSRIAKSHIVLHDFMGKTPFVIKVLEFLEQSDYRYFKKNITKELESQFATLSVSQIKPGTGIYICKKR